MKLPPIKIKAGQIWKRKKDGQRIFLINKRNDYFNCWIVGASVRKTHHIRLFDLIKYWQLDDPALQDPK